MSNFYRAFQEDIKFLLFSSYSIGIYKRRLPRLMLVFYIFCLFSFDSVKFIKLSHLSNAGESYV